MKKALIIVACTLGALSVLHLLMASESAGSDARARELIQVLKLLRAVSGPSWQCPAAAGKLCAFTTERATL